MQLWIPPSVIAMTESIWEASHGKDKDKDINVQKELIDKWQNALQ